jgi:hypothetical protein
MMMETGWVMFDLDELDELRHADEDESLTLAADLTVVGMLSGGRLPLGNLLRASVGGTAVTGAQMVPGGRWR